MAYVDESGLTDRQLVFVEEYLVDSDAKRAAIAAGYSPKTAEAIGSQLLNHSKYKHVQKLIEKKRAERSARMEKKGEDILRYIHTLMFFQPLQYFSPGDRGTWLISEEGLRNLPPEIGCLIEEVELVEIESDAGTMRKARVRLMSKTQAMTLAAKHQLGEKVNATHLHVNWDELFGATNSPTNSVDPVEERIRAYRPSLPNPNNLGKETGVG